MPITDPLDITIRDDSGNAINLILAQAPISVAISAQGMKGPPGDPGTGTGNYALVEKSANFTADGASLTFYLITAIGDITITLIASPGDGRVHKFVRIAGGGTLNFVAHAGDTINNASTGSQDTEMSLTSGVPELISVDGGWYVT